MKRPTASIDRPAVSLNPMLESIPNLRIGSSHLPSNEYAVIQWETAAFYTYEAEVDGKPVQSSDPHPPSTQMTLGIARLGSSKGTARVQWHTFDMSAKAGKHYREVKPTWLNFEDGETIKDVVVEVFPSPSFDGTVELGLHISQESAVGAQVGKYLHTATLKIIDSSCFPDDAVQDLCHGGNATKVMAVEPATLVWYFLKCAWSIDTVRIGSKKMIFVLQFGSLVAVLNIFIMLRTVDTLTDTNMAADAKKGLLFVYMLLWIVPFAGTHYFAYREQFWKVGGSLKKHLQVLLLKKFLNYTDDSRSQVSIDELIMALVRDVSAAVSDGYQAALTLVFGVFFKIVYLLATMVAIELLKGSDITPSPIIAVMSMPFFIAMFLRRRQKKSFTLREMQFETENLCINHVLKSVMNYQLIADYDRRTFALQNFESKIHDNNVATAKYNANSTNSLYFAPWLTTLLVGGYLLYGGIQVVDGVLDLASFLSTISIFRSLGSEFQVAYQLALKITAAYASIAQLTIYLNLPVDVPQRLNMTRARRKLGRELRAEKLAKLENDISALSPDDVPVDVLPIRMSNVHFKYEKPVDMEAEARAAALAKESASESSFDLPSFQSFKRLMSGNLGSPTPEGSSLQPESKSNQADTSVSKDIETGTEVAAVKITPKVAVRRPSLWKKLSANVKEITDGPNETEGELEGIEFELEQGKMVAVVGPPSQGKATILRLLAGQIFPDLSVQAGGAIPQLFVPPHLRIVQIQENPMVLGPEESIFDNLIFGVKQSPNMDLAALETRARAIMEKLDFNRVLLEKRFMEKGFLGVDGSRITRGDRQLIALGRAFVMNPEVIIAHKPTALLDDSHTSKVLEMFREFTDNRGVLMPDDEPLIRRRKRTAIFTAKSAAVASLSHTVFKAVKGNLILLPHEGTDATGGDKGANEGATTAETLLAIWH